jgi:hypothetical protein
MADVVDAGLGVWAGISRCEVRGKSLTLVPRWMILCCDKHTRCFLLPACLEPNGTVYQSMCLALDRLFALAVWRAREK